LNESVITRVVTVAGGRFAPGHLGELTQQVPFEMVGGLGRSPVRSWGAGGLGEGLCDKLEYS
jgi:hypothetical protein